MNGTAEANPTIDFHHRYGCIELFPEQWVGVNIYTTR
jgi:hypothetical protein